MIPKLTAIQDSTHLGLRYYEMKRSPEVHDAWAWFVALFFPAKAADVEAILQPAHPNNLRFLTVTSFWEEIASLVLEGRLKLYVDWVSEIMLTWSRVGQYVSQLRHESMSTVFLANVEEFVKSFPGRPESFLNSDEGNRRGRVIRQAIEYLPSGWSCSREDQEIILRDFEAVSANTQLEIAGICNLELVARHVTGKKIEGSYVECGVWQGGSLAYWARSFIRNGGDDSRTGLYGFDSFEGMPRMTLVDGDKASKWLYGKRLNELEKEFVDGSFVHTGVNMASEANCKAIVEATGYDKGSIQVVKGWFQNTLPKYKEEIGSISVLRLDADFYEATRFCLETMYENVTRNGVVIIDDYECFEGARIAVDEFIQKRGLDVNLIYYGHVGRFFFKP